MEQRIRARYEIVTALPAAQAAEIIAGEQSTGTFTRIPGETDELRERHGARMESVSSTGDSASVVELSWPFSNMGPSLSNVLATVAGNLWELKQLPPPRRNSSRNQGQLHYEAPRQGRREEKAADARQEGRRATGSKLSIECFQEAFV